MSLTIHSHFLRASCCALLAISGACQDLPTEDAASTSYTFSDYLERHVEYDEERDAYVVEGDMTFASLDAVRAHFDHYAVSDGALSQRVRNGNRLRWTTEQALHLTYCISSNFGATEHGWMQAYMEEAEQNWEQAAHVNFEYRPEEDANCSVSSNVVFRVQRSFGEDFLGKAFSPDVPVELRILYFDYDRVVNQPTAPFTAVSVLTHELGHILGFVHEMNTAPHPDCGDDDVSFVPLTTHDPASIMMYPAICGSQLPANATTTYLDRMGAAAVYGPARHRDPRIAVYRWWNAATNDWMTLADGEIPDQGMLDLGYAQKTFQFYAQSYPADYTIPIYRWFHAATDDWVTIAGGNDADMISWGYSRKTFQFYLRMAPDVSTVPVYRWFNPARQDWMTVANERTDAQMIADGYTQKTLLFHAPNSQVTIVPMFRWWHAASADWVMLGAHEATDAEMISWGYTDKTFVFFGKTVPFTGSVRVERWFHPGQSDWVTTIAGSPTDAEMTSWGYTNRTIQAFAPSSAISGITSPVARWRHPGISDWNTVATADLSDNLMMAYSYGQKIPLFHGLQ